MTNFDTAITSLHRIGTATQPKLKRLGVETVHDLLWYVPARYEDLSIITPIENLAPEVLTTVRGKIISLSSIRSFRKKLQITKADVEDETGTIHVTWFGQKFINKTLKEGDEVYISGKPKQDLTGFEFTNPIFEKVKEEQMHTAHVVPYYRLTSGISQKQLRFLIQTALKQIESIPDDIPTEIIEKEKFMTPLEAIKQIHRPESDELLKSAMERIKFDELFWMQLKAGFGRKLYESFDAPKIEFKEESIKKYIDGLPFTLTSDQKKVSWQILKDMTKNKPANRLVEGDVGSGKTVVASIAMLNAVLNGFQSVLMAPTELLAVQHYQELKKLFAKHTDSPSIALLTSKQTLLNDKKSTKKQIYEALSHGSIDCIIGTHSLVQEGVSIKNPGLVIIDEQHRFGVAQRKKLTEISQQSYAPHLISLTATPIPRTLALTLYGDLDISVIKEKPKGRLPIITRLVEEAKRDKAYSYIKDKIKKAQQVFVLCPLIDESDLSETKSVAAELKHLQEEVFLDLEIRGLHGKMKSDDKKKILQDFKENKFPILVTTSVIEVGIDIPSATIMVIEGAERFGLAQLHQFRGRVGRNDIQSYCLLFSSSRSDTTKKRLQLLTKYNDGFKLAEEDLKMRGEGDVFGTRQSGLVNFSIATIHDTELIKRSRKWVDIILSDVKHDLWNKAMQKRLEEVQKVHLE